MLQYPSSAALRDLPVDPRDEFAGVEGFGQEILHARFECEHAFFIARVGGEHDDRNCLGSDVGLEQFRRASAIHHRHDPIQEHDVGLA